MFLKIDCRKLDYIENKHVDLHLEINHGIYFFSNLAIIFSLYNKVNEYKLLIQVFNE